MDDQFNHNNNDFSMSGDVYNPISGHFNDSSIPTLDGKAETSNHFSMNGDAYNHKDDTYNNTNDDVLDNILDGENDNWKDQMNDEWRNGVGGNASKIDLSASMTSENLHNVQAEFKRRDDMNTYRLSKHDNDLSKAISDLSSSSAQKLATPKPKEDPKVLAEIKKVKGEIAILKARIDEIKERNLGDFIYNRVNGIYENKKYELYELTQLLNPSGADKKMEKMELLRSKYYELDRQKAELDQQMTAIELKFGSEGLSLEERGNKPDIESMVQETETDNDRLWDLRTKKREIYKNEYNVGDTGVTTHDASDFKKVDFMRRTLAAHQARRSVEHKANLLK